jgi:hypothetical protein
LKLIRIFITASKEKPETDDDKEDLTKQEICSKDGCSETLLEGAKFCQACGTPVTQKMIISKVDSSLSGSLSSEAFVKEIHGL